MYTPLNPRVHGDGDNLDTIELNPYTSPGGQYVPPGTQYAPPSGPPPDSKNKDLKALFQSNHAPVKNWPIHSQQVARLTPLRTFIIFFDAILASAPLMFIVLAIIAARLDGKEVSDYGLHLRQVLLLSPTIFPVVFAALMGRCFKHIGLWRAERGISLGRLEQLVGCQSLFSALERQISLRAWSILGLLMTLIWLLSPLGGQSALRLLDQEKEFVHLTGTYNYLNPMASTGSFLEGASSMNSGRATFVSVFLASLLSSSKYQATPMDLWGNVKIPVYRSLSGDSEWKSVDHSHNVTYASLIGIPVAGIRSGKASYTLKARQWDIKCDSNQEKSVNDSAFGNMTATWKLNYTDGRCKSYPCHINLKSLDQSGNVSVAECAMMYGYFEAAINCNGTDCRADKMKLLDLFSDGYTQDHDDFTRRNMISNEMNYLPSVDNAGVGSAAARGSTNAEKWMADPLDFIGATGGNVDLYKLSPELLSERFTIVWNSFFQSTFATTVLGGNISKNLTELEKPILQLTFNATQAQIVNETKEVYKTNWRWFVALLVASIILQIAAYTGLVLKYITLAPDIIGYASSLTLLNPYIPTPTGGTTLHGLERAALLHDLQIRIGDVCGNEPVGAIAVAKADEGRVTRLDRRRWYI
ncbi:hypothetical protein K469DRAFT_618364 [Zopfia rhizophila CBS 207.26]|uniref:Uncharacterized protein n=1 Tax=Zopfia rhizophila CBS 207.26 TaxID=1314779 RepID=A0A6A6EP16_9PEZI|nr:hypothetical protein K469DRAFT_618364 [Zopfia rhizophila CBS 207.26]